jgi:GT2 family glycosyltransferase
MKANPLKLSIIIPTRNRPRDLEALLHSILHQTWFPFEVIIIDDSDNDLTKKVVKKYETEFTKIGSKLKYIKGPKDGLPAARNLGIKFAEGDLIFFLDDDTLLEKNVIQTLILFFKNNPKALGVQPQILNIGGADSYSKHPSSHFENAIYKVLMLTYSAENKLGVRRSGMSIFPSILSRVITAQRLSGCCFCVKREIFTKFKFDENLKRWAYMEDLDFSYRVYKKNPGSLFAIPYAKVFHKHSQEGRISLKKTIYMSIIYWFYIFFKDFFEASILNLLAFMCALAGNLIVTTGGLLIKRKPKREWWNLIWLLAAYIIAFKNLRSILEYNLEFINKRFFIKGGLNAA